MSNLPNFLIVGAAKAGTTAVAHLLSQHPNIYISPLKEPKYISSKFIQFPLNGPGDDFVENFTIKKHSDYEKLFRHVKNQEVVGEASVENLYYYDQAIPEIKKLLGDVKIIIILRNPVDRAISAYKMLVRDGREHLSFEQALRAEPQRMKENYEFIWYYRDVGMYYRQVKAYLENFSQVKLLWFDDLVRDHKEFMRTIFEFLDVETHLKLQPLYELNKSGRIRGSLFRYIFRPDGFKGSVVKFLSLRGIPDSYLTSMVEVVRSRLIHPGMIFKRRTRRELRQGYREDVSNLQRLVGRDLRAWGAA
ncbi:MAG: sulfotransferase [Chitinivibrionales bacterium]|nr:sulfotransferase [Chitinivibrionales bacterium]